LVAVLGKILEKLNISFLFYTKKKLFDA